jgi:hypothetical protein
MACPGPYHGPDITYSIFIYYKNDRGENLLDTTTSGHYEKSDIRVNGNSGDFSIHNFGYGKIPLKEYALSFILPAGVNATGKATFLITLSKTDTDTLVSKNSDETLTACTYNGVNVLPSPLDSPVFPVVIVKTR